MYHTLDHTPFCRCCPIGRCRLRGQYESVVNLFFILDLVDRWTHSSVRDCLRHTPRYELQCHEGRLGIAILAIAGEHLPTMGSSVYLADSREPVYSVDVFAPQTPVTGCSVGEGFWGVFVILASTQNRQYFVVLRRLAAG